MFNKLTKLLCWLGRHKWKRVSTEHNGIGFLDECACCGRGRFLAYAGLASTTGTISKKELQKWHHEAIPKLPPHLEAGPLASAIARGLTHEEYKREFYGNNSPLK